MDQVSLTGKLPDIPLVGRKDVFECRFLQLHFLSHRGCFENPRCLTFLWTFHHWGVGLGMGTCLAKKMVERNKGLTYQLGEQSRAGSCFWVPLSLLAVLFTLLILQGSTQVSPCCGNLFRPALFLHVTPTSSS